MTVQPKQKKTIFFSFKKQSFKINLINEPHLSYLEVELQANTKNAILVCSWQEDIKWNKIHCEKEIWGLPYNVS